MENRLVSLRKLDCSPPYMDESSYPNPCYALHVDNQVDMSCVACVNIMNSYGTSF